MLKVVNLKKSYTSEAGKVGAVEGVDFEVQAGEVFALLGPSGCGKTTTLRCIAGLETPDGGEIWIGDRPIYNGQTKFIVPIHRRGVGMVFQSYAIWPHMTVFDNVAFPLVRGGFRVSKSEVKERVNNALRLGPDGWASATVLLLFSAADNSKGSRWPRALVYEPAVLLLDEPLSNLDAKLRQGMRLELRELVTRLHVTTIFVTHDQEEASGARRSHCGYARRIVETDREFERYLLATDQWFCGPICRRGQYVSRGRLKRFRRTAAWASCRVRSGRCRAGCRKRRESMKRSRSCFVRSLPSCTPKSAMVCRMSSLVL